MPRAGFAINGKKTRGLMGELGLQGQAPQGKVPTTQPNQVWVRDETYLGLNLDFVYLAIIMEVFTRQIRGWHLSRSLEQALTLTALQKALHNQRFRQ